MPEPEVKQLGTMIQAYVRARWRGGPDQVADLEPQLRERVDILGMDGERLLDVAAESVLAELEKLEQAAAREDARVEAAAARIRAREIDRQDAAKPNPNPRSGSRAKAKPKAARGDAAARPGRNRPPATPGRRRQRRQR